MITPAAFRNSLTSRARTHAKTSRSTTGALVEQFLYDRLLARVFGREPDGWLVKGGQALLRRYPNARTTRDLDLLARHYTLDEAVAELRAAAETDLKDFMRFVYRDAETLVEGHLTRRVKFDVYFGVQRGNMISVDVVTSRTPYGQPAVRQLEACIPGTPVTDWPQITLYPITDHTVDKIAALYELHGNPPTTASTRFRDLVDLLLIALREPLDGAELHTTLRSEVERRRALGTTITLPERFIVPNPAIWTSGYAKAAKDVVGLADYATISAATSLADRFITPLLGAESPSRWEPESLNWVVSSDTAQS